LNLLKSGRYNAASGVLPALMQGVVGMAPQAPDMSGMMSVLQKNREFDQQVLNDNRAANQKILEREFQTGDKDHPLDTAGMNEASNIISQYYGKDIADLPSSLLAKEIGSIKQFKLGDNQSLIGAMRYGQNGTTNDLNTMHNAMLDSDGNLVYKTATGQVIRTVPKGRLETNNPNWLNDAFNSRIIGQDKADHVLLNYKKGQQ
jgi:hypothetical protein